MLMPSKLYNQIPLRTIWTATVAGNLGTSGTRTLGSTISLPRSTSRITSGPLNWSFHSNYLQSIAGITFHDNSIASPESSVSACAISFQVTAFSQFHTYIGSIEFVNSFIDIQTSPGKITTYTGAISNQTMSVTRGTAGSVTTPSSTVTYKVCWNSNLDSISPVITLMLNDNIEVSIDDIGIGRVWINGSLKAIGADVERVTLIKHVTVTLPQVTSGTHGPGAWYNVASSVVMKDPVCIVRDANGPQRVGKLRLVRLNPAQVEGSPIVPSNITTLQESTLDTPTTIDEFDDNLLGYTLPNISSLDQRSKVLGGGIGLFARAEIAGTVNLEVGDQSTNFTLSSTYPAALSPSTISVLTHIDTPDGLRVEDLPDYIGDLKVKLKAVL